MNGTNATKVNIHEAPKKRTPEPKVPIEVFGIEKEIVPVKIVGTSQLICNKFHEKGVQEIEDQRRMDAEEKRAKKRAPRPPVIPEERYMLARELDSEGRDCVPARYIKSALVTAATKYGEIGVPGTVVRGALFVLGDLLPITYKGVKPWAALKEYTDEKMVPVMRRDVVRVGKPPSKQPDLRYRPGYDDWSLDIVIEFEPALISRAGLFQLIRRAGTSVGLCEWRPEKSPAGIFGRFDVAGVEQ